MVIVGQLRLAAWFPETEVNPSQPTTLNKVKSAKQLQTILYWMEKCLNLWASVVSEQFHTLPHSPLNPPKGLSLMAQLSFPADPGPLGSLLRPSGVDDEEMSSAWHLSCFVPPPVILLGFCPGNFQAGIGPLKPHHAAWASRFALRPEVPLEVYLVKKKRPERVPPRAWLTWSTFSRVSLAFLAATGWLNNGLW